MIRLDASLLACWWLVLGLGLVMVASASVAMDAPYLLRHGTYLLIALIGFLVVLAVPLNFWQRCHRLALVGAVALCAVILIPGVADEVRGAKRWVQLGGFSLQPAELAKAAVIVYFAGHLAKRDKALRESPAALGMPLLWFGALAVLLLLQPDFGTVVVLSGLAFAMLFLAGIRLRYFLLVISVGGTLLALLAWAQPYRMARLVSFVDPWATAFDSGYQLTHSLIAFGRGELLGLGLGDGIQKLWYLPDAHNDFIYAVLAEELGLLGALALLVLLAVLVQRILGTARAVLGLGHKFGGYVCYGVGLLLALQMLINIGVTTGSLPTKGLTLPFISYGGNSLIVCSALIGLVCRAQLEAARA